MLFCLIAALRWQMCSWQEGLPIKVSAGLGKNVGNIGGKGGCGDVCGEGMFIDL